MKNKSWKLSFNGFLNSISAATAALKRLDVQQIKQAKLDQAAEGSFDFSLPKMPKFCTSFVLTSKTFVNNGPTFNFMTNSTNSTSIYFSQS